MLNKLKRVISCVLEPFAELTTAGRLLVVGVVLFVATALLPAVRPQMQIVVACIVGLAFMCAAVAAVWTWWQERKENPKAKFYQAGSPFQWAADMGACGGFAALFCGIAFGGYISLGLIIYHGIRGCA